MSNAVRKIGKESVQFKAIESGPWAGTSLAEIFESDGDTKMSCGIHEIPASETDVPNPPVDDVLYILEGELEILSQGVVTKLGAGDFAYMTAGTPQKLIVPNRVKLMYVTYPCKWK